MFNKIEHPPFFIKKILGSYGDRVVLTGGWASYFILERFGEGRRHCGSVDIDFVLRYYKGGPQKVAEEVRSFLGESVVAEAFGEIRDKFRNVRSEGPFQVAYFLAPEDERLRERIQGEAYAVLRALFDGLENR